MVVGPSTHHPPFYHPNSNIEYSMNARNILEALMGILRPERITPANPKVPIEETDGHYLCAEAEYSAVNATNPSAPPITIDWSMGSIMKALRDAPVVPGLEGIESSLQNLCPKIPDTGTIPSAVIQHVVEGLSIGLLKGQSGPR